MAMTQPLDLCVLYAARHPAAWTAEYCAQPRDVLLSLPTPCPPARLASKAFTLVATLLYLLTPFSSRPSPSSLCSPNLSGRSHADRPSIIGQWHKRTCHLESPVVPCRTLCTRPLAHRISVLTVSLLGIHFYCEKGRCSFIYFLRHISRSPLHPLLRFPLLL